MKRRLMLLAAILCLTAMAGAQTIYENGPVSGVNQEPRFDHSNSVSNTFTVSGGNSTVTGVSIWTMIGIADHNPGAEVIISSGQNGGGTVYFDRTVQFSNETNCYANLWGYNNCQETTNWTGGPTLPNGSYWLTLRHEHRTQRIGLWMGRECRLRLPVSGVSLAGVPAICGYHSLRSVHHSRHHRR